MAVMVGNILSAEVSTDKVDISKVEGVALSRISCDVRGSCFKSPELL